MPEETRHLRTEDRKIISRMKKDNKSQAEIARTIGFSQGTISKVNGVIAHGLTGIGGVEAC